MGQMQMALLGSMADRESELALARQKKEIFMI